MTLLSPNLIADIRVGNTAVVEIEFVPTDEDTAHVLAIDLKVLDANKNEHSCLWEEVAPNQFRGYYDIPDTGPAGVWIFRWDTLIGPNAAGELKFNVVGSNFISLSEGGPVVDHDELGGLLQDDHPQYLLRSEYAGADYIVSQLSNGHYKARSMTGGTDYEHISDAGYVTNLAINNLGTAGGRIILQGELAWQSVPEIPKDIVDKGLHLQGLDCTITLTEAGPRGFDFTEPHAPHDTFRNVELTDLIIDNNFVSGGSIGRGHVIIGNAQNITVSDMHVNFENITIRRCTALNLPPFETIAGYNRRGISFGLRQITDNEPIQTFARNILFEDVTIVGGTIGWAMGGGSGGTGESNCMNDNITWIRCKHLKPGGMFESGGGPGGADVGIHLGQNAKVGKVTIRDCYFEYSADVGIEINNGEDVLIENTEIYNTTYPFFFTNYGPDTSAIPLVERQNYTLRNCTVRYDDDSFWTPTLGVFNVEAGDNGPTARKSFGTITFDNCSYYNTANRFGPLDSEANRVFHLGGGSTNGGIKRAVINNCRVVFEGISYNNAAESSRNRVIQNQGAIIDRLVIRDFHVRFAGQVTGAGKLGIRVLALDWSGSDTYLDVDGMVVDLDVTGQPGGGSIEIVDLGGSQIIQGVIRNVRVLNATDDTNSLGVFVASFTAAPAGVRIEDCDFSPTTQEIVDVFGTMTPTGLIVTKHNIYTTKPTIYGMTGLVTAVGKIVGSAHTAVFFSCIARFGPGTGVGITAVDFSTNGGTNWINVLTQAAAPMPAGLPLLIGPLMPKDLIRVTFTTTQPTISLVPYDP